MIFASFTADFKLRNGNRLVLVKFNNYSHKSCKFGFIVMPVILCN